MGKDTTALTAAEIIDAEPVPEIELRSSQELEELEEKAKLLWYIAKMRSERAWGTPEHKALFQEQIRISKAHEALRSELNVVRMLAKMTS